MTEASAADLAVIIVNYETGAWLERCLGSLERARSDVSVEVVVIDNASGDGSADVSEALGARVIRNDTNRWLSPAWHQGAAATQTPYLLFLNPDTEWSHGTVADLVAAARRHPRAGIVGPMLRNPDRTVYPSGRRFPSLVTRSDTHSCRRSPETIPSRGATKWTVGIGPPNSRSIGSAAPPC
jgi:N-acetylglucosaminyl-diphospho-decaprenol L-rhamnosyltransferase